MNSRARYQPLLALILLSLGGCMIGPDFLPKNYRN